MVGAVHNLQKEVRERGLENKKKEQQQHIKLFKTNTRLKGLGHRSLVITSPVLNSHLYRVTSLNLKQNSHKRYQETVES